MTSQGLLNRWTSKYDWGITAGGLTFNLNNGTKTHLIIVKLLENTFLGMTKVSPWIDLVPNITELESSYRSKIGKFD